MLVACLMVAKKEQVLRQEILIFRYLRRKKIELERNLFHLSAKYITTSKLSLAKRVAVLDGGLERKEC